jgi:hypothetical protein
VIAAEAAQTAKRRRAAAAPNQRWRPATRSLSPRHHAASGRQHAAEDASLRPRRRTANRMFPHRHRSGTLQLTAHWPTAPPATHCRRGLGIAGPWTVPLQTQRPMAARRWWWLRRRPAKACPAAACCGCGAPTHACRDRKDGAGTGSDDMSHELRGWEAGRHYKTEATVLGHWA